MELLGWGVFEKYQIWTRTIVFQMALALEWKVIMFLELSFSKSWGRQLIYWLTFPKNCMKMEKNWTVMGDVSLTPPWICRWFGCFVQGSNTCFFIADNFSYRNVRKDFMIPVRRGKPFLYWSDWLCVHDLRVSDVKVVKWLSFMKCSANFYENPFVAHYSLGKYIFFLCLFHYQKITF